jgi:transposase
MSRKPIQPKTAHGNEIYDYCQRARGNLPAFLRMKLLWRLICDIDDETMTRQEIAEQYSFSLRTLQRLIKLYNEKGFEGIVERDYKRRGRRPFITKSMLTEKIYPLLESLRNPADHSFSAKQLHRLLTQEHGVQIKFPTLIKTLHRHRIYPQPARRRQEIDSGLTSPAESPNGGQNNPLPPEPPNPEDHAFRVRLSKLADLRHCHRAFENRPLAGTSKPATPR